MSITKIRLACGFREYRCVTEQPEVWAFDFDPLVVHRSVYPFESKSKWTVALKESGIALAASLDLLSAQKFALSVKDFSIFSDIGLLDYLGGYDAKQHPDLPKLLIAARFFKVRLL